MPSFILELVLQTRHISMFAQSSSILDLMASEILINRVSDSAAIDLVVLLFFFQKKKQKALFRFPED
jgi:hypothetical protein